MATGALVLAVALGLLQAAAAADGWRQLYRPLRLPRVAPGGTCPVSRIGRRVDWEHVKFPGSPGIGRGPVYPGMSPGAQVDVTPDTQYGGNWRGAKVFWYVSPRYRGPVLIRGRQLDGTHWLGFNGRKLPLRGLRIHTYDTVAFGGAPGSRGVPSDVRALVPGCYGVQIDGTRFSRTVIFRVDHYNAPPASPDFTVGSTTVSLPEQCAPDRVARSVISRLDTFDSGRARAFSHGFLAGKSPARQTFDPYNGEALPGYRSSLKTQPGIERIARALHRRGDGWTATQLGPPTGTVGLPGRAVYGLTLQVIRRGYASYEGNVKLVIACDSGRISHWVGPGGPS